METTAPPAPAPVPGAPARAVFPARGAARALSSAVRLYQAARAGRPPSCRFWPSCSEYAVDAFSEHGATKGGWLAIRRLTRCHPWGGHGVDPVPGRAAR